MLRIRLILAVVSTAFEEAAIWLVWRWVLPGFGVRLAAGWLILVMAVWAVGSVSLFMFTTGMLKRRAMAGQTSMVGMHGRAAETLSPGGFVRIKGELWSAVAAEGEIDAGEPVEVIGEEGLKLVVRKAPATR